MDFGCFSGISIGSLILRALAFVVVLGFFPRRLVPVSAKFALAFALFLLLSDGSSNTGAACSEELQITQVIFPAFEIALLEVVTGVVSALSVSMMAYVVMLFSAWLSNILFGVQQASDNCFLPAKAMFSSFVFLYFLTLIPPDRLVGRDLFAVVENGLFPFEMFTEVFKIGLVLILPLAVISVVLDFAFLVGNRFLEGVATSRALLSVRMPILIFIFSITLAAFSEKLL